MFRLCQTLKLQSLLSFSTRQLFCSTAFNCLSPLDGRYSSQTAVLRPFFSQAALMKYRVKVEAEWMLHLIRNRVVPESQTCSIEKLERELRSLHEGFGDRAASRIKEIEKKTNHDLKSVEYYMKENISSEYKQSVHLCCTSEDINNLAYSLMLKQAVGKVMLSALTKIDARLQERSLEWAGDAMLARTHGQPATPTTLGKEMANFAYRVRRQTKHISEVRLTGKINGAVGNYNAHYFAYPDIDWLNVNREFVEKVLGLQFNPYTTQIQSHDSLARLFGQLALGNTILIGLCRDMWQYSSKGYIRQRVNADEVGSSTMPHKVNPIDFENCEGNLGIANSTLLHLREKLPISRLQRDLSDSTVLRNQGSALGYTLIGYNSLLKGLGKVSSDKLAMINELKEHQEVITEAIQTELRKIGYPQPYEYLKKLSRGRQFTVETKNQLIQDLRGKVPPETIQKIRDLSPQNYLGKAFELANSVKNH